MKGRDFALIALLGLLFLLGVAVVLPVRREMDEKQKHLAILAAEKEALQKELTLLEKENELLRKGDPYMTMRVARETFRYCYPNEKVYHFRQEGEQSSTHTAVPTPAPAPIQP